MAAIPFIQARNYTPASGRAITTIVIHDMEYPERPQGAEWCADFFHNQPPHNPPKYSGSSAHYTVDNNTVVCCVRDKDVAWAAPGNNHNGIQIEHAGYARQTRAEWLDEYSKAELKRSAALVAKLCKKYKIPVRRLRAADLRDQKAGITGHADVTLAWKRSSHTDPGQHFPWPEYLTWVDEALAAKR